MPYAYAYFPGIQQIMDATLTISHGTMPSVAILTIAPQRNFTAEGGTLTWVVGGDRFELPGCKVDYNSFHRDSSGEIWQLTILDRRWKWTDNGRISGQYNRRHPDDDTAKEVIDTDTEKTPQELAKLLFKELNEDNPDVTELPNELRPYIDWDGDSPAEELNRLCESMGCRVVYQYLKNKFKICRVGQGADLPGGPILENSLTINPPEKPDALGVQCGRTKFQLDLELEDVGREGDGSLKRLSDLSYRPATGFNPFDPYQIAVTYKIGANQSYADTIYRKLARQCAYRWYRIKFPFFVQDEVGNFINIEDIHMLGIETEQLDFCTDDNEIHEPRPAQVYGIWWPWNDWTLSTASAIGPIDNDKLTRMDSLVTVPFSIDVRRGIVMFSEPVFILDSTNAAQAPTLRLRTSFTIRDKDTRGWLRYRRSKDLGGKFGTPTRYVRHDEIELQIKHRYFDDTFVIKGTDTNLNDKGGVNEQCDFYIGAEKRYLQIENPQSIKYPGLMKVELDGAIQQVTFALRPAVTTVCRNSERRHVSLTYKQRRDIDQRKSHKEIVAKQDVLQVKAELATRMENIA